mmetsp:Transcript_27395/g.63955  ORF Transcript_27395/g.63955 Transcript_27395/m.63955 type:complete len:550 (+) Transcript_27395:82-1731(+)
MDAKSAKAAGKEAEDGPQRPPDPPAGGLDIAEPGIPREAEAFPGEAQLTEDEYNRVYVLHFALPRTITTCDLTEERTTEAELNEVLAAMAWGTLSESTHEWELESEEPTLEPPQEDLISYAEYMDRLYPANELMDPEARQENVKKAKEKKATFTNHGEPGVKFRPMFDQMLKCLAFTNKAQLKAFGISKVVLNEYDVPEDDSKDDTQNMMRFGRHQILPSFWNLIFHLAQTKCRFLLVFRTYGEELEMLQREVQYVCQGQHPGFKGKRTPLMNGERHSRDMRLKDEYIARFDRKAGKLEFASLNAVPPAPEQPAEQQAAAEAPPPAEGAAEGEGASTEVKAELGVAFEPTVYEFPPWHKVYAGLMHQIFEQVNTVAIVDDLAYWNEAKRAPTAGMPLLVDYGGSFAETKVQHIFFSGHIGAKDSGCVDVRDVVSGEPIPFEEANGVFLHRVDFFQAITDTEYYIKALEACQLKLSQKVVESRKVESHIDGTRPEVLKQLPCKEYLYRTVIPALLPALDACQRYRPADPLEFIAFHMLRHPKQYSKTLAP